MNKGSRTVQKVEKMEKVNQKPEIVDIDDINNLTKEDSISSPKDNSKTLGMTVSLLNKADKIIEPICIDDDDDDEEEKEEDRFNFRKTNSLKKRDIKQVHKTKYEAETYDGIYKSHESLNKTKEKLAEKHLEDFLESQNAKKFHNSTNETIKGWVRQTGWGPTKIIKYLDKFAEAFSFLASGEPKTFSRVFRTIHSMAIEKNKEIEELIVYPDKEKEGAILDYLDKAKHSIKICVNQFTNEQILNKLKQMKYRGVSVQIISDIKCRVKLAPYYAAMEGMEFRHTSITPGAQLHHKFAVIDTKFVINASFNWTTNAVKKNHENIMITSSKNFVRKFNSVFDKMWIELPYTLTKEESKDFIKTEERFQRHRGYPEN